MWNMHIKTFTSNITNFRKRIKIFKLVLQQLVFISNDWFWYQDMNCLLIYNLLSSIANFSKLFFVSCHFILINDNVVIFQVWFLWNISIRRLKIVIEIIKKRCLDLFIITWTINQFLIFQIYRVKEWKDNNVLQRI